MTDQLSCKWVTTAAPSGAVIRGAYRYLLWRTLPDGTGTVVFIMLNPSTADAEVLDPTVRRCMRFAKTWGYARLEVVNLFAFRSTDPDKLLTDEEPVGDHNELWIENACLRAHLVVAAWGAHKAAGGQGRDVAALLRAAGIPLHCLGTTQDGTPRHPLYVRADTQPVLWEPPSHASEDR